MTDPAHLANLPPEQKRALLARMLEERAAKTRRFPLSFAQQRLWFIEQLEPGNAAYHVWSALRVRGPLDFGVLEKTVREIVRRHQTLRTTFEMVDAEPVQVVAPQGAPALLLADFRGLPEELREAEARRAGQAAIHAPFDLVRGPLLRLFALRIADGEVLLYMAMHHIVSDGWSLGLWVQELAAIYGAFAAGRPSPLPPLPLQYGDFAQWQRQSLAGERLERLLAWWRERLSGAPAVLELPTDRPRPAVQSFRGASVSFALLRELHERLAALAQREGATLFMVLLAGFQLLLSRYSRQEDVSTGTPTAGRDREELEGLIGFFASMLVLRTDLSGDPPFRGLLARVRETALSAFEHQEIPFEKLVDALQLPRDPSHTPLFQVEFVLQNTPEPSLQAQDLTLAPLSAERETAKFDLLLEMFESPAGLFGVLEHNRDLFDRSTAARLTRGFERLLAAIVDAPETPVSRLPLLPEAERHQVLAEWNDTAHPWNGFRTLHGMFEDRVREQPEAPAAVFEDESLTYRELSARANQLAHHLRRLGVGPDVRVAVSLERSLDLVTTLLGVLKAGGAYVPIDPDYPADRRAFMLEDS
ncbi:MAG TPA: condensation domain-containing protein, partial [Thermoanaerobaculia bacterium]|nr:condensation domain-containing protein [Thermoanaerobaculia bacterium]